MFKIAILLWQKLRIRRLALGFEVVANWSSLLEHSAAAPALHPEAPQLQPAAATAPRPRLCAWPLSAIFELGTSASLPHFLPTQNRRACPKRAPSAFGESRTGIACRTVGKE